MFSIAYRMLGSVSDAEDVVQEAFLRMHRDVSDGRRRLAKAYAATVTTRLAIDHLRLARTRRERYVGTWLPEPLPTAEAGDPAAAAERAESLSMAFLVLLERLSPVERAVLVLREVFEYDYASRRDRRPVRRQLPPDPGPGPRAHRRRAAPVRRLPSQRDALARRFFAAVDQGDSPAWIGLLAADVTSSTPTATASPRP